MGSRFLGTTQAGSLGGGSVLSTHWSGSYGALTVGALSRKVILKWLRRKEEWSCVSGGMFMLGIGWGSGIHKNQRHNQPKPNKLKSLLFLAQSNLPPSINDILECRAIYQPPSNNAVMTMCLTSTHSTTAYLLWWIVRIRSSSSMHRLSWSKTNANAGVTLPFAEGVPLPPY